MTQNVYAGSVQLRDVQRTGTSRNSRVPTQRLRRSPCSANYPRYDIHHVDDKIMKTNMIELTDSMIGRQSSVQTGNFNN